MVKKTLSFFNRVILTIRQAVERESDQHDRPEKAGGELVWLVPGDTDTANKFFGSPGSQFVKSAQVMSEIFNMHCAKPVNEHRIAESATIRRRSRSLSVCDRNLCECAMLPVEEVELPVNGCRSGYVSDPGHPELRLRHKKSSGKTGAI